MNFIKFVRIFLLVLIAIGIGLLLTQKMWVPKVVDKILGPQENTMNSENKIIEKVDNQEIQSQRELYCKDEFADKVTKGFPNEAKAIIDRINTCSFLAGEVGGGDMDEVNKAQHEYGCGALDKDQSDLIKKYSENQVVVNAIKSAIFWRSGEACYGNAIKAKLTKDNHAWVEAAGYFEGTLTFEDIQNKSYPVTLCVKEWPKLKTDNKYVLNLDNLAENTRLNGELSGCYLGDINSLFNTTK